MPPRRSSRAASAKPTSKAPPTKDAQKSSPNPRSQPARKRAASPERAPAPPSKRPRTAVAIKQTENEPSAPKKKPASRAGSITRTAQPPAKRGRPKLAAIPEGIDKPTPQLQPYFNPLPTAPPKERPGLVLFAWGAGNFGQCGMGPDVLYEIDKPKRNQWVEQQIEKGTFGEIGAGIESIAGGGLHTLFTDEKGTIWTCGVNDNAALGRITTDVPDPNNPGSFLDVDELTSVPWPVQSLVDEQFRAVRIAAGDNIGAAISDQGEFRVWGTFRGMEGALGFSDGKAKQELPTSILKLSHKPGDTEKVTAAAAGNNHLLIATTHGNLYTLGAGEQGQLGRKILERRKIHGTHPEKISLGSRSRKVVDVGAGSYHSFAIDENGDVWGWGLNTMGQTGTGWESPADDIVLLPRKVEALSNENLDSDVVIQISGGEHHTLFLTKSGRVYSCGRLDGGQLGLEDDHPVVTEWAKEYSEKFKGQAPQFLPTPTLVTFPDDYDDPVVQISCGLHNNSVTTKGGALYSWGQGPQGELGCQGDEEVRTPKVVVRKDGGAWFAAAVSCGGQHTLGLLRKKQ